MFEFNNLFIHKMRYYFLFIYLVGNTAWPVEWQKTRRWRSCL